MKVSLQTCLLSCVFLLLGFGATSALLADSLRIENDFKKQSLGKVLHILEDEQGELSIVEVSNGSASDSFKQNTSDVPNFGYIDSVFWVRFTLDNPSHSIFRGYVEYNYPTIDRIEFYRPRDDGLYNKVISGDQVPFSSREFNHRTFLFEIEVPPDSSRTFYMRVRSTAVTMPLMVWSEDALLDHIPREQIILGVYYGILLIMVIFNAFVFLSLKDRTYLFYILYVSSFLMFELVINGTAFQYLWSDQVWWANNSLVLFSTLGAFFALQFSREFLQTSLYVPVLHKILRYGGWLALLNFVICFFDYSISNRMVIALVGVMVPVTFASGLLCRRRGNYTARYYILAWTVLFAGVMVHVLKTYGYLPTLFVTDWADEFGSAAEVALLSFGLAARINEMKRKETEMLEELRQKNDELGRKNRLLVNYEKTLEQRINERTAELHEALSSLNTSNQELIEARERAIHADQMKSEFLANISHELKTPMQGIMGFSKLGVNKAGKTGEKKLAEYFQTIYSSGNRLLNLINNLIDLSKLESGGETYEFRKVKLSFLTQLVISEMEEGAKKKNQTIVFPLPDFDDSATVDYQKLITVIRNYLKNAIHFSPEGNSIEIAIKKEDKSLHYTVKDYGIGIPGGELDTIFDRFAESSRTKTNAGGTGLGLAICRKIIQNHGGQVWAESSHELGSTFHFTVPVDHPSKQ